MKSSIIRWAAVILSLPKRLAARIRSADCRKPEPKPKCEPSTCTPPTATAAVANEILDLEEHIRH